MCTRACVRRVHERSYVHERARVCDKHVIGVHACMHTTPGSSKYAVAIAAAADTSSAPIRVRSSGSRASASAGGVSSTTHGHGSCAVGGLPLKCGGWRRNGDAPCIEEPGSAEAVRRECHAGRFVCGGRQPRRSTRGSAARTADLPAGAVSGPTPHKCAGRWVRPRHAVTHSLRCGAPLGLDHARPG